MCRASLWSSLSPCPCRFESRSAKSSARASRRVPRLEGCFTPPKNIRASTHEWRKRRSCAWSRKHGLPRGLRVPGPLGAGTWARAGLGRFGGLLVQRPRAGASVQ